MFKPGTLAKEYQEEVKLESDHDHTKAEQVGTRHRLRPHRPKPSKPNQPLPEEPLPWPHTDKPSAEFPIMDKPIPGWKPPYPYPLPVTTEIPENRPPWTPADDNGWNEPEPWQSPKPQLEWNPPPQISERPPWTPYPGELNPGVPDHRPPYKPERPWIPPYTVPEHNY